MIGRQTGGILLTLVSLLLSAPARAEAGATPPRWRFGPGQGRLRTVTTVAEQDSTVIRVGPERVAVPTTAMAHWDATAVTLGSQTVAVARVGTDQTGRWGLVAGIRRGRPTLLWSGRLSPRGDPGERIAARIEVTDVDGDGNDDIVVGTTHERTRLCGQQALPLLEAKRVRPTDLELVPHNWVSGLTPKAPITPLAQAPHGWPATPSVKLLVPKAASTQAGAGDRLTRSAPWALVDGKPETAWVAAPDDPAPFVTFWWDSARFALEALSVTLPAAITLPAAMGQASETARPKVLWLLGQEERYRVELPAAAAAPPGSPLWLPLPKPLTGQCLSVVVAERFPGTTATTGPAAIAEIGGFSRLETEGGLSRLVEGLRSGEGEASRLLTGAGPAAVPALSGAWASLDAAGQRRAVTVLAAHARASEGARDLLATAHSTSAGEVRAAIRAALLGASAAGATALAAEVGKAHGDEAALALARAGRVEVVPPLLTALAAEGGADRAQLRRALTDVVLHNPAALEPIQAWSAQPPPVHAGAAVALALAQAPAGQALATRLVAAALPEATEFADRYRLIEASKRLPANREADAWLGRQATEAEEWMVRTAALSALDQRGSPAAAELARGLLDDGVPRVRAAAVRVLAARKQASERLAKHAQNDVWFLVRATVVETLPDSDTTRALVRGRVDDPNSVVRAAAIDRLTGLAERSAWPAVEKRLRLPREYPGVVSSGIRFARVLCIKDASEVLSEIVTRGLGPRALESGKELGVQALGALAHLGSDEASALAAAFGSGTGAGGLQRAVHDAASGPVGCPAR